MLPRMGQRAGSTVAAALVGALVGLCALAWTPPPGSLDDAFVVWADARIWASGSIPAVEGSTSALDVGCKALIYLLAGPDLDPLRAAGAFGICTFLGAVAAAAWFGHALGGGAAGFLAASGVATSIGVVESVAFRLEGGLHLLLWVTNLGCAALRWPRRTLACGALLGLARPEGLLLVPLLAAWAARCAGPLRYAGAGSGIVGAVVLARLALFGAPWPNTFYAKSSDSRLSEVVDGLGYAARAAIESTGGAALVLLAGAVAWAIARSEKGSDLWTSTSAGLGAFAAAAALLLIGSGGDAYEGARLALPLGAPLWLALAHLARPAGAFARRAALCGGLALLLQVGGALRAPVLWGPSALAETSARVVGGPLGVEALEGEPSAFAAAREALAGETLAHRHAQRIRWFEPGLTVLDMTGLTDREVARRPHPGANRFGRDALDLALERRVGAIHLDVPFAPVRAIAGLGSTAEVLGDASLTGELMGTVASEGPLIDLLARLYLPASYRLHGTPGAVRWFNLFVRADLAERFEEAGFVVSR